MKLSAARADAVAAAALALTVAGAIIVGCTPGAVDPGSPGVAGQGVAGTSAAGGVGTAGASGAGSTGAAGAACVTPPVVKMAWTVGRDATSPEITCDQAGAMTVQILMNSTASQFPCNAKTGTSVGLMAGSYTPRVALASAQGMVLSQGFLNPVTIPSCGVTDLGRLRFVVTPTGAAGAGGSPGTGGTGTGTGGAAGGGAGGSTGAAGTGGGTGPCDAMPIFALHSCAAAMACHDANGAAAAFNMKTTGWEKTLVGKLPKGSGAAPGLGSVCATGANATTPYLMAGSQPARGLFLDKLFNAKPACGAQMPLIPPNLSASEMDCVQRWANGLTK